MNYIVAVVQCCTHGLRGARAEMGDICSVCVPQLAMDQVCNQACNYVLKYLKHLHEALGRTETRIIFLRQHTTHQLVLSLSLT